MYSGVPKAGAPVRMSTFEVNDPMAQGTPGLMHWSSTMAASPSATNCVTAPARVTGAIAPARGEGGDDDGLPAAREPHGAVEHRPVVLERRGGVDVGVHARRRLERLGREPARDADHLHHVLDARGAERIGMRDLVGEGELVVEAVEMAYRGVQVHRLHRIAAGQCGCS